MTTDCIWSHLVILVSRVVDSKRIIEKMEGKEEERHKGSMTQKIALESFGAVRGHKAFGGTRDRVGFERLEVLGFDLMNQFRQ
jgi:hypothetical protein